MAQDPQPVQQTHKRRFRDRLPEWARYLPLLNFPKEPLRDFSLLPPRELDRVMATHTPESAERLRADLEFAETRLMRHFISMDFDAKYHQNRHRLFQILFMFLAFFATLVGSFLALAVNSSPEIVPILGLFDTLVALVTTYVATIAYRVDSHGMWLERRQRAEQLRREYFRFLLDLAPYDTVDDIERRRLFAQRAASIRVGEAIDDSMEEDS